MTTRYICPLCNHSSYNLLSIGYVASTPWTDECCCCDQNNCVAHQVNPLDMPTRPSKSIMLERAQRIADKRRTEFNQKVKNIEKTYQQMKKLADLALEIKEYLGYSFETIEEFKEVVDCLRSNFFEDIDEIIQNINKGK